MGHTSSSFREGYDVTMKPIVDKAFMHGFCVQLS